MSSSEIRTTFHPHWLLNLPIKKKLYLIIGLLIGNIVFIISLGIFVLNTLSSIRASIAAEDLWAKAQKTAIYSLGKYALSQDENAYQDYLEAIKVPIVFDRANQELKKAKPEARVLEQAFFDGGSHPKDVRGMAFLFMHFQNVPHISTAFQVWGRAQGLIDEVQGIAKQLRANYLVHNETKEDAARVIAQIDSLNHTITALEIKFSSELGEASRWATSFFLWMMIGGSILIGLASVAFAFYISSGIVKGIGMIGQAASQAAQGDLSVRVAINSKDELGKLSDAFNDMTEGLRNLDKLKTDFFANISHEFRTPLTLMLGPLEDSLTDDTHPLEPEQRTRQEFATRNAHRLLKLVNSLLDFSRIEASKIQADYEPTDLPKLTRDLASHFESAMNKAGLKFIVTTPPIDEPVFVDREMWEKIVLNLLSNAFKYTLKGEIELQLKSVCNHVELAVRDSGIGIPEKELKNIFKRFYRVESSRGRTFEGTGIGLALIQELVNMHGGSLSVTSQVNQGSIFTVKIPLGSAHLPANQSGGKGATKSTKIRAEVMAEEALRWLPVGEGPPLKQVNGGLSAYGAGPRIHADKILLADDNADMRAYVENLLKPHWRVTSVSDGQEAYEEALNGGYALVLSDVMMPRLDGFGLVKQLRENPTTKMIPIILISARAGEEAKVAGVQSGADDYLIKPFSAKELVARVRTHLELRHLRDEHEKVTEERLKLALASAEMGAWDWDIKTNRVNWDEGVDRLFGMAPGAFSGTFGAFINLVHLDDRKKTSELIEQSVKNRSLYNAEFRVVWPDGNTHWIQAIGRPFFEGSNTPVKMIGIAFETTKRKADEEELRKAIRARDEFLSIASHELKTPLTSLYLQLQMIEQMVSSAKSNTDLELKKITPKIDVSTKQAKQLGGLIDNLLDVSRIEAGKLSIEGEDFDLIEVIQEVILRFDEDRKRAGNMINLHAKEQVMGHWDKIRITQAITNLMSNALKYGAGKSVDIFVEKSADLVLVKTQDHGVGIDRKDQARIFNRFERATSYHNISGLGLGLYITKQIVEAHKGRVSVESEPLKGSTFTIELPLYGKA